MSVLRHCLSNDNHNFSLRSISTKTNNLILPQRRPVKVTCSADPTKEEVQKVHQTLLDEVARIWAEHKPAWETRELSIE